MDFPRSDILAEFDHIRGRKDGNNKKLQAEQRNLKLRWGYKEIDVENEKKKSKLNCVHDLKQCVDGDIEQYWQTPINSDLEYYSDLGSETYRKYQSQQSCVREDGLIYDCSEKGSLDKSVSEKYQSTQIANRHACEKCQSTQTEIEEGDILTDEGLVTADRIVSDCVASVATDDLEEHCECLPENSKTGLVVKCLDSKNGKSIDIIEKLADECIVRTPEKCHSVHAMMVSLHSCTSILHSWASSQCAAAPSLQNSRPTSALCINKCVHIVSIGFDVSWKVVSHVIAEASRELSHAYLLVIQIKIVF